MKRQHRFTEQYELVQGAHLGYMDREDAVAVNRRIIHIKPDIYIVADELYHGGSHEYRQYWHFSEKGRVTLRSSDKREAGPDCCGHGGNRSRNRAVSGSRVLDQPYLCAVFFSGKRAGGGKRHQPYCQGL
ncbi:MAG: heparinase II/III family protein [Enterocloster clostridioformis]